MTLTIDPATGAASGELPCSHPISALRQRTRFGENYAHWFCNECEAIVSRRTDRERHLAALREYSNRTIAYEPQLRIAIRYFLPELERGAAVATTGEFPSEKEFRMAWDRAGTHHEGYIAIRDLCASRAPKVEWPAWFVDYVRWVNEKPGAKYATAPENGWRELLSLIEGSEKP